MKRTSVNAIAVVIILGWLHIPEASSALETAQQVSSDYPSDSRFITIQLPLIAKATFLFDRFEGVSYQLVSMEEGGLAWQPVLKLPNILDTNQSIGKVNYMCFFSGLASRFTFLVNLRSGATWQLCEDEKVRLFWNPVYITTAP